MLSIAISCIASTASERNPPIRKSALSRVIARSMALVASGTDWISLVSIRTSSTGSFRLPTWMPPPLLISSRAISAPAQWFSPCTKAIGPRIAILIEPCACTSGAAAASAAASSNERTMVPSCGLAESVLWRGVWQQTHGASRPGLQAGPWDA